MCGTGPSSMKNSEAIEWAESTTRARLDGSVGGGRSG